MPLGVVSLSLFPSFSLFLSLSLFLTLNLIPLLRHLLSRVIMAGECMSMATKERMHISV